MFRPVIQRLSQIPSSTRSYSSVIVKDGNSGVFSEEEIFKRFQVEGTDEASTKDLTAILKQRGIRADDPRVTMAQKLLKKFVKKKNADSDVKHYRLPRAEFIECVRPCLGLISQAVRNELIIPSWNPFTQKMTLIFDQCRSITEGSLATYIPQLARQNPDIWGMSVCTVDGQRFGVGDSREPFCFQSVSKPFTYAIVSTDIGSDKVHQYIGQEPSGRLFNEICLDNNLKPHNPMVNAGAIICASLIKGGERMSDRFDFIFNEYKKLAGGTYIGFDNATFLSERGTADRNFSLAYFMKENHCFPKGIKSMRDELDLYFQLCSLETDCESAAVMAATLANGGVCPLTGDNCIAHRACRDVLALMYSCGMYDYSGQFAFSVGVPAKSGVSGGLILVIPNVMGICLYSPKLDQCGNSVKGVEFAKKMVECMGLHNYDSLLHSDEKKLDPRKDWTLRKDLWPGIENIKGRGIGKMCAHEKRNERRSRK